MGGIALPALLGPREDAVADAQRTALAALQRQLIAAAAEIVRPGGMLVYATCSLEPEENEQQMQDFLDAHPGWTSEPPPEGTVPGAMLDERGWLRVLPQHYGVDGAFGARLRRRA